MDTINICISCDDNYSIQAGVVITSILSNSLESDDLRFYILDGGISEKHKAEILSLKELKNCEINFININQDLFKDYTKIKTHDYLSMATYYRLKLPTLLPSLDKIIYLDCDIIVNSSLKELFNKNLEGYLLAGVLDISKRKVKKNPTYINAGMILFNLKAMREEHIEEEFLKCAYIKKQEIKTGDQSIINEVCKGKILLIESEWNVQSSNFTNRSSYTNKPKIIHFVARKKPWHWASYSYHRDLYFKYLQLTPWKLSEEDYINWTKHNQKASLFSYFKYRPFFFIRPRFYKALIKTYLLKG